MAPRSQATLEPSGFSPGVSQRELLELEGGFPELELLYLKLIRLIYSCELLP
jgi:hypothetical protein